MSRSVRETAHVVRAVIVVVSVWIELAIILFQTVLVALAVAGRGNLFA
jgi:hypothetical protein